MSTSKNSIWTETRSKEWYKKFDKIMLSNNFKINECDKFIYFKNASNGFITVNVYIANMLILGSDEMIDYIKKMIKINFNVMDMRVADVTVYWNKSYWIIGWFSIVSITLN